MIELTSNVGYTTHLQPSIKSLRMYLHLATTQTIASVLNRGGGGGGGGTEGRDANLFSVLE